VEWEPLTELILDPIYESVITMGDGGDGDVVMETETEMEMDRTVEAEKITKERRHILSLFFVWSSLKSVKEIFSIKVRMTHTKSIYKESQIISMNSSTQ
jgi:hypothetical protein